MRSEEKVKLWLTQRLCDVFIAQFLALSCLTALEMVWYARLISHGFYTLGPIRIMDLAHS